MRERLEVASCPTCWPKELMSLSGLTPEEKSKAMKGNWELMVAVLRVWDVMQGDLQRNDVSRMVELWQGEWQEVWEVYQELLEHKLEDLRGKEWYEVDGKRRWKIGSELADVMVLTFALWRMKGLDEERLLAYLEGNVSLSQVGIDEVELLTTIEIIRFMSKKFGVDLVEMTILKTLINYQHRPPFLEAEWRNNGFMKGMRREIGDDATTQMPDLGLVIGLTVLAKYVDERHEYFKKKVSIGSKKLEIEPERQPAKELEENLGYPGNEALPWASLRRV